MKIMIIKKTMCSDMSNCSNIIRKKIEDKYSNLKLMAIKKDDTVNGAITILHEPNNHKITIEFYDKDENPNNKHLTKLKKYTGTEVKESELKKIL